MIVYKWVIKKRNEYHPIINNGGHAGYFWRDKGLKPYEKGHTIKNYIDPHKLNRGIRQGYDFDIPGFHFWRTIDNKTKERYQRCMKSIKGTQINCTLKCFIREKDIIKKDNQRIIAKQFRILGEL